MKTTELEALPLGTKLIYSGSREVEVTLVGFCTTQPTPGRYVKKPLVRRADGREGTTPARTLRLADPVARATSTLTPAMRRALAGVSADGTVCDTGRNTEGALIRRGLAEAVIGIAERPDYRRSGVYGRTTTVYDAYLGARLTDLGRAVAARLQKGEWP